MKIVYAWFYYSFYYILLGAFVTLFINRLTKKLYLAPLLINAISAVILFILAKQKILDTEKATYALYFNYMPTVATSIFMNVMYFLIKKIEELRKNE